MTSLGDGNSEHRLAIRPFRGYIETALVCGDGHDVPVGCLKQCHQQSMLFERAEPARSVWEGRQLLVNDLGIPVRMVVIQNRVDRPQKLVGGHCDGTNVADAAVIGR